MWVSKGELAAWKERALRAEAQVDALLAEKPATVVEHIPAKIEESGTEDGYNDDQLPPPVEDAIARRARPGSDLERTLQQQARDAMSKGGRDFDADAFARHIDVGSRISGWPL